MFIGSNSSHSVVLVFMLHGSDCIASAVMAWYGVQVSVGDAAVAVGMVSCSFDPAVPLLRS